MSETPSRETAVELFVRADPAFGAEQSRRSTIDRLQELSENGQIDEFDVNVWTKSLCPSGALRGTDYHEDLMSRVEEFVSWIEDVDGDPESSFRRDRLHSEFTGEDHSVITLPMMCLAVYEDGDLVSVHPYHDGSEHHSVHERIAEIAPGDERASEDVGQAEAR